MTFTTQDGAEYEVTKFGSVKQTNAQLYKYDANYVSRDYDKPDYREKAQRLSMIRFAFMCGAHGSTPHSLVDVGYGRGDFMKVARQWVEVVSGLDITGVPVPEGCHFIDKMIPAEVYCYHDVLEHFEDISFVKDIPATTLIVSLPNLRVTPHRPEFLNWFESWKHRKKNEHIRYFDSWSLHNTMAAYGWKTVAHSYHEDFVRENRENRPNILSMAFRRK